MTTAKRRRILARRVLSLVGAITLVGVLLVPAPALADPHAGAMECAFFSANGGGPGSCTGQIWGADVGPPGVTCLTGCSFFLAVDQYSPICVHGEMPLLGTASGRVFISGQDVGSFSLVIAGAGVVFASETTGVGGFVPIPDLPPSTCENPVVGNYKGLITATIGVL